MKNENKRGIYIITNKTTKKQYVGSSKNVYYRMQRHKCNLRELKHCNAKLQAAYNKYGLEDFTFKVLEFVETDEELLTREQFYIDSLKPAYNILQIAGNVLGLKHTLETIEKCIAANIRRTGTHHSGHKGRVFKFNKDTEEVIDVYSSGGSAAESVKHKLKGTIETAANKIGESIKRNATAYGYRWQFEKNLAQIKVDELLEILAKKQTISSQAIDISIEGSETT
jgi:group I intron endonuclease